MFLRQLNVNILKFSKTFRLSQVRMVECGCADSKKMAKKALVFLAPGTEEMEFVISVDVLRRAEVFNINVIIAGLAPSPVKCSRGVNIVPDINISEALKKGPYDIVIMPGGLGGSKAFEKSEEVGKLLKSQETSGGYIGAICAAPTALKAHGIATGKNVTSYPAMEIQMTEGGLYSYKHDKVVVDGKLVTSQGPGTSFDFALKIVDLLCGKEKASEVAKAMLLSY